jgi:hypothetical protein
MQGQQNHGAAHYRCRFPSDYALTDATTHPRNVYLRESAVVPELDRWLAQAFNAENLDETCDALAVASAADHSTDARADAARRKIADGDARLKRYRKTLDAGGDPLVIAGWMRRSKGNVKRQRRNFAKAFPLSSSQQHN